MHAETTECEGTMIDSNNGLLPPNPDTAQGNPRRLGVELEFSGMDIDTASTIVEAQFGGSVEVVSDFEHRVQDTSLGEFNVELDFEYLKAAGRDESLDRDSLLDHLPQWMVAEMARLVVPIEVVSPPVAMQKITCLDAVVDRLRDAGALGTRQSPVYAFGMHLNPEMPALDSVTITRYLRAFLCLYEWLLRESDVDWSRRLTPYINPFPTEYVRLVVSPDYAPTLTDLMDDYLATNADRNRALDMLPLFAHIDERRVRDSIDDPRIKPRPTLHYRLANCDIDLNDWGIVTAWRHWLEVERLANDHDRLRSIATAYRDHLGAISSRAFGDWAAQCDQWL